MSQRSVKSDHLKVPDPFLSRSRSTSEATVNPVTFTRSLLSVQQATAPQSTKTPAANPTVASEATYVRATRLPLPPSTIVTDLAQISGSTKEVPMTRTSTSRPLSRRTSVQQTKAAAGSLQSLPSLPAVSEATYVQAPQKPPSSSRTAAPRKNSTQPPSAVQQVADDTALERSYPQSRQTTRTDHSAGSSPQRGDVPILLADSCRAQSPQDAMSAIAEPVNGSSVQVTQSRRLLPSHATSNTAITPTQRPHSPQHRLQTPLPRSALSHQSSGIGLSREHRIPSGANLTAHFEPESYPMPASRTGTAASGSVSTVDTPSARPESTPSNNPPPVPEKLHGRAGHMPNIAPRQMSPKRAARRNAYCQSHLKQAEFKPTNV